MNTSQSKIPILRLLFVHFVRLGHAVIFLTAAALLANNSGGVQGVIRDVPAMLFLLAGLSLILSTFWFSFRTKCRLALLAVSMSLSLYSLEMGIRLWAPALALSEIKDIRIARRAELARRAGKHFDTRNLLEVILDLRADGKPAFPSGNFESYLKENIVSDEWFRYDDSAWGVKRSAIWVNGKEILPLGQPAHHLGVGTDNENGHYVVFETDEHGFRNPPGLWSLDEIDVMGLGDSFTEGCEVQDHESFMSRIREKIPRTINLGLGGGGPFTMLACVREYGRVLEPKLVLWCFYEGNDIRNLVTRMRIPILNAYLREDFRQNLLQCQPKLDAAIREFLEGAVQQQVARAGTSTGNKLRNKAFSFITLEHIRTKLGLQSQARLLNVAAPQEDVIGNMEWATGFDRLDKQHLDLFIQILGLAKSEVKSWGGRLYFVYLPAWDRVSDPRFQAATLSASGSVSDDTNSAASEPRSKILAGARSLDVGVIDLSTSFAEHPDPLSLFPFRLHGHYSPQGNQFVADEILKRLLRDRAQVAATQD